VPETLLLAAAIGLSLAVGGALLIEFLDNTVKTPEDVAQAMDLPLLGTIADIQERKGEGKLVTSRYPQSPITESFRALRTSIDYYSVDKPIKTLVVTSAGPSEGKSLVLANLAVVMAQAGRHVVVVDADMRRPMQHKIFHVDNERGLSDAIMAPEADLSVYNHELSPEEISMHHKLGGDDDLSFTASPIGLGTLHIVTTGPRPPNPPDLLASKRMQLLIKKWVEQADIVLFDTPPTLIVTDAVVLSKLVDGVLVLANAGRTKRAAARQTVERFRGVNANILGAVLNQVSRRAGDYYSYRYYHGREEEV
jgi:Mrp family chromosome partitioning ATPase